MDARALFDAFDVDKNGDIDADELMTGMLERGMEIDDIAALFRVSPHSDGFVPEPSTARLPYLTLP